MDIFTRFNRKSIDDRQIDTFIGLSKGLLADGRIDPSEAQFLYQWLTQCRQTTNHPIFVNLLTRVQAMLSDGVLDRDEADELLTTLRQVAGEPAEFGEIAKSASLPLCRPAPSVTSAASHFYSPAPAPMEPGNNAKTPRRNLVAFVPKTSTRPCITSYLEHM